LIGNNNNTVRYDGFNNNMNMFENTDKKLFTNNKLITNSNNKMINRNMDNLSPKISNKKSKVLARSNNLVMNTY